VGDNARLRLCLRWVGVARSVALPMAFSPAKTKWERETSSNLLRQKMCNGPTAGKLLRLVGWERPARARTPSGHGGVLAFETSSRHLRWQTAKHETVFGFRQ